MEEKLSYKRAYVDLIKESSIQIDMFDFERIPEGDNESNQETSKQISEFFEDEQLIQQALRISPRAAECLSQLKDVYVNHLEDDDDLGFSFQDRISRCFYPIHYNVCPGGSHVCGKQHSRRLRFYKCLDCQVDPNKEGLLCEKCFVNHHAGHKFRNKGSGTCNCGDPQVLKSDNFCPKHTKQHHKPKSEINPKDQKLFTEEVTFFIYLVIKLRKKQFDSLSDSHTNDLMERILKTTMWVLGNSVPYQQLMSDILVNSFPKDYKMEEKSIVRHFFDSEWSSECDSKFQKILEWSTKLDNSSMKLFFELWQSATAQQTGSNTAWNMLSNLDVDNFLKNDALMATYLKQNKIKLLSFKIKEEYERSDTNFLDHVFDFYDTLSKNASYPQIALHFVETVDIKTMWSYNSSNLRYGASRLKRKFKNWCFSFFKAINRLEQKKEVLLKMVRASCASVFAGQNTDLKAQMFLAFSLISYFDADLSPLEQMSRSQLAVFLDFNGQFGATIEKMNNLVAESFEPNDVDLDDRKSSRKGSAIFFAVNKVFSILYKVLSQGSTNSFLVPAMKEAIQEVTEAIPKLKAKIESAAEGQDFDDRQFGREEESVGQNIKAICQKVMTFCTCAQTNMHELILCPLIGVKRPDLVNKVYRELLLIHKELSKKEFSKLLKNWVRDEQLIKQFIEGHYSERTKIQEQDESQEYYSNLSVNSDYVPNQISPQMTSRFMQKLSTTSSTPLTNFILTEELRKTISAPIREFIGYIKAYPFEQRRASDEMGQGLDFVMRLIVTLYSQTKEQEYIDWFEELPIQDYLDRGSLGDYEKDLVTLFKDKVVSTSVKDSKAEKLKRMQKLRHARSLRNKKMRALREKQEEFLNKNAKVEEEQKIQQSSESSEGKDKDACIMCKLPGQNESPLKSLCFVKLSNLMTRKILEVGTPFLLFTSCNHLIHHKCQQEYHKDNHGESEDDHDQDSSYFANRRQEKRQYSCFLCRKDSNIRIPDLSNLKKGEGQEIINEFIKKLNENMNKLKENYQENDQLSNIDLVPELTIDNLGEYLFKSTVFQIFLYFLSHPPLFIYKHLKMLAIIIDLMKHLKIDLNKVEQDLEPHFKKEYFTCVYQMVVYLTLPSKPYPTQFKDRYCDQYDTSKQELKKLMTQLKKGDPQEYNKRVDHQRINLYNPPQDLADLTSLTGPCYNCQKPDSELLTCLFCGVRVCQKCKKFKNNHYGTYHLGHFAFMDMQDGTLEVWDGSDSQFTPPLYYNSQGRRFNLDMKIEVVQKGQFMLSHKKWDMWVERLLMESHTYDQDEDSEQESDSD